MTKKQGKWRKRVREWLHKHKKKANQEAPLPSFISRWMKRHEEMLDKQISLYEVEEEPTED